jgi:hypothetical protein
MLLSNETVRAVLFAFVALAGALGWLAVRASAVPSAMPERLIAEFRVVRLAALLLALSAGTSIGLAAAHQSVPAGALDVTLAAGFVALAAVALTKDPRHALMMLAGGFAAHALLDIAHRPGWLSAELGPHWFFIAGAVYDVAAGAICYLPLLRR